MRLLAPSAILLLLVAAGSAAAESTSSVKYTFTDLTHADMRMVQTWSGEEATTFRTELDRTFGNGDGTLNDTEIQRIVDGSKRDIEGGWHPMIRMNGNYGHVLSADVEQEGLAGAVTSTERITLTHNLRLEWNASEGNDTHRFNTTLGTGSYAEEGDFEVVAPSGWRIESVEGFSDSPQTGGQSVKGKVARGEDVRVTFAEGTQEGRGGGTGIPSPGVIAVVGLAMVAALLARRR